MFETKAVLSDHTNRCLELLAIQDELGRLSALLLVSDDLGNVAAYEQACAMWDAARVNQP